MATAQRLFQDRGYDTVSVAEVTEALGINPPSFYAAFGNKAGLYARVLDRWTRTEAIPLADLLSPERPVAEALAMVLEDAARRYGGCGAGGCMVLEGVRDADPGARDAALALNLAAEKMIRDYVAARHPDAADPITDFVATVMAGLSARARRGDGVDRLLATARLAADALRRALPD